MAQLSAKQSGNSLSNVASLVVGLTHEVVVDGCLEPDLTSR